MAEELIRWDEMPEFMLYNDQLCNIARAEIEKFLLEKDSVVTMAMVNNYVKNEIIKKPIKKKYIREHLASVIVIAFLKQVLSIDEIKKGIELMLNNYSPQEAYDMFSELIELEWDMIENGRTYDESKYNVHLVRATRCIANNIYVKRHLNQV
ncbi:MAG: DUF1836 domain-containing protein [Tissierellia bacterium]|nr:DUF1836 domain-containing protein [Tissierellia bacterium]